MKHLLTGLAAGACTLSSFSLQAVNKQRPNIVFILADDLGWNDLGCTGSSYYETPQIDRIAREGVRFTRGYAGCQVSSPSRASILTGKTPARHGVTNWIGERSGEQWRQLNRYSKLLPAEYKHSLPLEETTLPEILKENGYATFIAGKWHLGGEGSEPENHGFEINIGGYNSGSPRGGYFSPYENPKLPDGPPGENLSIRLATEMAGFIADHYKHNKKGNHPFFAYLSFYAVHSPIQTTQEKWQYYRDKAEKQGIVPVGFEVDRTLPVRQKQDNPIYAGLVAQMDEAVGIVLDKLKELGIEDNTIVIFTSDNGGVSSGDNYSTSCLPLRGGKGKQWEGGLRVPFLMRYPGHIQIGSTQEEPVVGMDLYPTLLDYASIPLQSRQHVDGISLKPLLSGEQLCERSLFWHYPHYGNQGGEPSSIINEGGWKLIYYHEDERYELYNLSIDESESEPVNIQYRDKAEELKNKLHTWLVDVNARMPLPDPLYNPLKEAEYKKRLRTQVLGNLERQRKEQLTKGWTPDKDWWNSNPVAD